MKILWSETFRFEDAYEDDDVMYKSTESYAEADEERGDETVAFSTTAWWSWEIVDLLRREMP